MDVEFKSGLHIGGLVEIPVKKNFAVQPELIYSVQGSKYSYGYHGNTRLDYINIKVLAKFYVNKNFSIEVGPQLGFNVKANETHHRSSYSIREDVNTVDFALAAGVTYRLNNGLFFSGRYNLGLTNIAKYSDDYITNCVLQLSVGYRF